MEGELYMNLFLQIIVTLHVDGVVIFALARPHNLQPSQIFAMYLRIMGIRVYSQQEMEQGPRSNTRLQTRGYTPRWTRAQTCGDTSSDLNP